MMLSITPLVFRTTVNHVGNIRHGSGSVNRNVYNCRPIYYIEVGGAMPKNVPKTIQTRVYPTTLKIVKAEVLRRRKDGKYQPPLDTPASVIRDAVEYYLADDGDPSIVSGTGVFTKAGIQ
jgi:hypothetical protein